MPRTSRLLTLLGLFAPAAWTAVSCGGQTQGPQGEDGGAAGMGGELALGGASAGGEASQGGRSTGGTSSAGGTSSTGGTSSAGGTSSTGGTSSAGGNQGSGGNDSGGSSSVGGSSAVGGNSAGGGVGSGGAPSDAACVAGFFDSNYPGGPVSCQPWTQCPPGEYASQTPNRYRDRICAPCPEGTFTHQPPSALECRSWSGCPFGQVSDPPPSATHDSTCVDADSFLAWPFEHLPTRIDLAATSQGVYLTASGVDGSNLVLRYALDGKTRSTATLPAGTIEGLTTLGSDLFVAGTAWADVYGGERHATVSTLDAALASQGSFALDSENSVAATSRIATDGTHLFVARVEYPEVCTPAGEAEVCAPAEVSELVASSYTLEGELRWEQRSPLPYSESRLVDVVVGGDGSFFVLAGPIYYTHLRFVIHYAGDGTPLADFDDQQLGCSDCRGLTRDPGGDVYLLGKPIGQTHYTIQRHSAGLWLPFATVGEEPEDSFADFLATASGFYLVGDDWEWGQETPSTWADALVVHLDVDGTFLSRKTAGGPTGERFFAIAEAPDGQLYLGGQTVDPSATPDMLFVTPWDE